MSKIGRNTALLLAGTLGLFASGCATAPETGDEGVEDESLALADDELTLDESVDTAEGELVSEWYVVRPGDSLWRIASRRCGDGQRWTRIYRDNRGTIGPNPDLIRPGMSLWINC